MHPTAQSSNEGILAAARQCFVHTCMRHLIRISTLTGPARQDGDPVRCCRWSMMCVGDRHRRLVATFTDVPCRFVVALRRARRARVRCSGRVLAGHRAAEVPVTRKMWPANQRAVINDA
jgi:hypothetical protein